MNKLLRTLLLLLLSSNSLFSQKKLSLSSTSGHLTFVYQLTDKEVLMVASKSKSVINDSFMHTLVDSFYTDIKKPYKKVLPYGNYLHVSAIKNELSYQLVPVYNVDIKLIENRKDLPFAVTDLKGNLIEGSEVFKGNGARIKYDEISKLYITGKLSKDAVIVVKHNGVNNYFIVDADVARIRSERKAPKRKIRKPVPEKPIDVDYKGYMVYNKPKYKPLDTVKFKAYLVTKKGKALINKQLRVDLLPLYEDKPGKTLAKLNPYHEGGYEYSFVLSDSLDLTLDRQYVIALFENKGKEWKEVIRKSFTYEDYELKSIDFAIRADKEVHSPGSPVTIFMKASDENELAVPDGRVEITVKTSYVSAYHENKVFVKDSLWAKSINLDPIGETKLVLPDSIFPNANLSFTVQAAFLNSNNESRTANKNLRYTTEDKEIKTDYKKDSLHINYLVNGLSTSQKAVVYTSYLSTDDKDSMQVTLPARIKMNHRASDYLIKTEGGFKHEISLEGLRPTVNISAVQSKDSLQVVIGNEHKIPFWYTLFSGDKIFLRGHSSTLDTIVKHNGSRAAHIRIDYLWDWASLSQEASAVYSPQILNLKLLAPEIVYPGQKVEMQVKVTDINDQPVEGTDVTAYAHTAKFKEPNTVGLPTFGKTFQGRLLKPRMDLEDISLSGKFKLNWDKWGKQLGLDTIVYYQFTQTKDLFAIQERNNDTTAVIAPFVVKDGKILPVHIVYIDDIPVFFNQAEQLKRYAFSVRPGLHTIRMRTSGYMITLENYDIPKGKKTIISAHADLLNDKVKVTAAPDELTDFEASLLSNYMIRIADNFSRHMTVIKTDNAEVLLNPPPQVTRKKELLIGPFKENYLNIKFGSLDQNFIKEPGYSFTFLPNLLKQKSWGAKYVFDTGLGISALGSDDYKQYPVKTGEIDSLWSEYLDLRSHTTPLFNYTNHHGIGKTGQLVMKLDSTIIKAMPFVKNIIVYKNDEPTFLQVYPGNVVSTNALDEGKYKIIYLFKDNRYFVANDIQILSSGRNYFQWKDMKIQAADNFSIKLDGYIKSVGVGNMFAGQARDMISESLNERYFDVSAFTFTMKGRVLDEKKKPLAGVSVKIAGVNYGTTTDKNGYFEFKVPKKGKARFSCVGFLNVEINTANKDIGDLVLKENKSSLDEVVVVGYAAVTRNATTGSSYIVTTGSTLQGKVAGLNIANASQQVMIRGLSTLSNSTTKTLIFVDGLPYDKDISSLDPNLIAEMNVLKGEDATAIYGSSAANGVILIKTKGGNLLQATPLEGQSDKSSMRTNFSDYAIWQPKLITDNEGKASFAVKFPDDITNWTTRLVAMNGRKQGGLLETNIKSFKTLSANFVSPLFAIAGDSINVIGKLMNYTNMNEKAIRKFSFNDAEVLNNAVSFKNAHIDTMSIVARGIGKTEVDSLKFEYTMKQDNGYFDGEIRKIPLFQAGVTETKGVFNALTKDTTITYQFDAELGKVTLRAEASVFPTLLDEMKKLRNYEYLCNEQLASKLKALLLEKTVRKYLGQDFKEEKNIKDLLKKLQANRRPEGTWGWWQNSGEEMWISLHVVETLLEAQKQGYTISLDKDKLYAYLVNKLAGINSFDQIYAVRLLKMLNEKYYINDWVQAIEKQSLATKKQHPEYEQPLYEKLQIMELRQMADMPVDINWLLSIKKETMFGNIYWGTASYRFWDNSIQNTLLAYQILRNANKNKNELDAILRYFLEQRKDGQWRNTFESSRILKTILPELIVEGKKYEPSTISLNNAEKITAFPYTSIIEPAKALTLTKKGDAPVYFTAFQQFNNPKPEKVNKDFKVKTTFLQDNNEVKNLKPGKQTVLSVEVEVRADADYVMIEIPIPAGCSYENKQQAFWGVETHREYFKNKTSIFCTKLKQGKYTFNVELMPRYSGSYSLNPAKAEMMYFPVFYGREGMKKVSVN